MLQLALEVIAETKPTNGKAKESYDALMRLVEGEKEVAWAESQNCVILPHVAAPHLVDNVENNISPAFLQSSGILTCHTTSLDTTQLHSVSHVADTVAGNGDNFDGENNGSAELEMVDVNIIEGVDDSVIVPTDVLHFQGSKNVTYNWAERMPVPMAINQERTMTMPLACTSTVTKLPKSPHPRCLQATLTATQVITPSNRTNFNASVKSPFVPSSLAKDKQCVGMATIANNMAVTPKCGYKTNVNDLRNGGTPGTKQPFANLPPIFAPTLMKAKSESPDKESPSNGQSQTTKLDCNGGTPVTIGFEDNFVPCNSYNHKNLSPDQVSHDITYFVDKESTVLLNQTYTRAISELEKDEDVVDDRDSKAAARRVGQEIWQKVNNVDYPIDQPQPLRTVQCDGEHVKKMPGYLTMTKSAANKRLPSTRQPLLKSNKENIPVGRKRTNTAKQSNRTVRPLARSASVKSRPVAFNW